MPPPATLRDRLAALVDHLRQPVDGASVALMRFAFGALMVWDGYRYLSNGWVLNYWIRPSHFFHYDGFSWVRPWPGQGMYWHFGFLIAAAAAMALGAAWRLSAAVFAVLFGMVFLFDQANYLNHFYLITLLGFAWIFIPAHTTASVDAALRPSIATADVPRWSLWLLRFLIAVPYFFGGVAKLNPDWLRGEPMRQWLLQRSDWPYVGSLFQTESATWFFAYGGLALDLFIVPALLWKKTRKWAFIGALAFHGLNAQLFSIGVFPWMMMAATTIFFEPEWPREIFRWFARPAPRPVPPLNPAGAAGFVLLAAFVTAQVLIPFRHLLYPGYVSWTEEGHRFSWHMKLRDKEATTVIRAREPGTGRTWKVLPSDYLSPRQVTKFQDQPDMLKKFALIVAEDHRKKTGRELEIRAEVMCSLNGRKKQLLIDPEIDLVRAPWGLGPTPWILPLKTPLK
ncbi:MAG: HTTM domain-containing protein [Candidatus Brocadiae bacterium]|nr:HTTM domain-containing protein [Candidatus Brocadiia bacterium]